jgi:hypothetical protein
LLFTLAVVRVALTASCGYACASRRPSAPPRPIPRPAPVTIATSSASFTRFTYTAPDSSGVRAATG